MSKVFSASKALIVKDNKFLIIKTVIDDYFDWCLPGGKVDFNETPYETLKREVKEEINIEIKTEKVIGIYWFFRKIDGNQVNCTTFLCKPLNTEIDLTQNPCAENIKEYKWITKEEFLNGDYPVPDKSLKDMINSFDFL